MFGRVVPPEPLDEAACFGGGEGLVHHARIDLDQCCVVGAPLPRRGSASDLLVGRTTGGRGRPLLERLPASLTTFARVVLSCYTPDVPSYLFTSRQNPLLCVVTPAPTGASLPAQ
jgi:hypothetical protein